MGTDVVRAGSTQPTDLIALAADPQAWSIEAATPMAGQIEEARARLNAVALSPLKELEPDGIGRQGDRITFDGARSKIIADGLKPLGVKVQGRMSREEANVWLGAMVMALSDVPFAFLKKGIADAIHHPFRFLNEIEGVVRERAAIAASKHKAALRRLNDLERSLQPVEDALPAPPDELTQDEINAMDRQFLNMGLRAGFITQEQFDIAFEQAEKGD